MLDSRDAVRELISWEGGLTAALEYGLKPADMPQDDTELRDAWSELLGVYQEAVEKAQTVERLLGIVQ